MTSNIKPFQNTIRTAAESCLNQQQSNADICYVKETINEFDDILMVL